MRHKSKVNDDRHTQVAKMSIVRQPAVAKHKVTLQMWVDLEKNTWQSILKSLVRGKQKND